MSLTLTYLYRDGGPFLQKIASKATITAAITATIFLTRSLITLLSSVNLSKLVILTAYWRRTPISPFYLVITRQYIQIIEARSRQ